MTKTHHQMWEECLAIIKDNLPAEQYDAWFKPITSASYDAESERLHLMVPSMFFKEQLEERYLRLLAPTLFKVYGKGVKLFYDIRVVDNDPASSVSMESDRPSPAIQRPVAPLKNAPADDFDSQLNPKNTFENYCGSDCNKIALSISERIATDPTCKTFNPLFVFGSTGVGKTHLIQAIGIRCKETRPQARVLYVPARVLESQYVEASMAKPSRVNELINFYQSIDVLIVDDIQDLMHKPGTQSAFFHIFNHLHQNQKQIVMSSDCPPSDLKEMPDRLLSRFKWGMTCQLDSPDYNLRREVLEQRASKDGLSIPADVLDFIAENVTESIRELEGIVVSLLAHATILNRDITVDLARSVLSNSVRIKKKTINFDHIIQSVADYYNLDPEQIFNKTRKREISDARQMVMYMARKLAHMPITAIGTRLARTHATVHHACTSIEERMPIDATLRADIEKIEAMIKG